MRVLSRKQTGYCGLYGMVLVKGAGIATKYQPAPRGWRTNNADNSKSYSPSAVVARGDGASDSHYACWTKTLGENNGDDNSVATLYAALSHTHARTLDDPLSLLRSSKAFLPRHDRSRMHVLWYAHHQPLPVRSSRRATNTPE